MTPNQRTLAAMDHEMFVRVLNGADHTDVYSEEDVQAELKNRFLAGTPVPRVKWEYRKIDNDAFDAMWPELNYVETLNKLGEDGWSYVESPTLGKKFGEPAFYIFKRART